MTLLTLRRAIWFRRRTFFTGERLLVWGIALFLFYLILAPLAMTVFTAFRGPLDLLPFEPAARTTLANFVDIVAGGRLTSTVRDTTVYVTGSVLIAFVVGGSLAWVIERTDLPFRNVLFVVALGGLLVPGMPCSVRQLQ